MGGDDDADDDDVAVVVETGRMFPKLDELLRVAGDSLAAVDMRPPPLVFSPPPPPLPVRVGEYKEFPTALPPVAAKPKPPNIDDAVLLCEDAVASKECVCAP